MLVKVLREELKRALSGESDSHIKTIHEMLNETEMNIHFFDQRNKSTDVKISAAIAYRDALIQMSTSFESWSEIFDNSEMVLQRTMLTNLIHKVIVYQDDIKIIYNPIIDNYIINSHNTMSSI